jgi:UBA-like domain
MAEAGADAVESFKAVTQANDETAQFYLSAADGDVQRAVDTFFAGEQPFWCGAPHVLATCCLSCMSKAPEIACSPAARQPCIQRRLLNSLVPPIVCRTPARHTFVSRISHTCCAGGGDNGVPPEAAAGHTAPASTSNPLAERATTLRQRRTQNTQANGGTPGASTSADAHRGGSGGGGGGGFRRGLGAVLGAIARVGVAVLRSLQGALGALCRLILPAALYHALARAPRPFH